MFIYLNLIDTPEERDKFKQIYERYKNIMFYVANNILKDNHLAEDALQEAFIRIAKNVHKISEVSCPETKGFVVTIVRNVSLTMIRGNNQNTIPIEDYSDTVSNDFNLEDIYLEKVNFGIIVEEIMKLSDIYKSVLYLELINDLSIREIAISLDISIETARKRRQRGRRILSRELERAGVVNE